MPNRHRTPEEFAFNRIVGINLKYLRKNRSLTQTRVAKEIDVTFQQIQKYEKGANGLCANKLKKLADFFKVKMDVVLDPNFITAHRDFSGKMDWLQHEADIEMEQERQTFQEKFMKENKDVNHKY